MPPGGVEVLVALVRDADGRDDRRCSLEEILEALDLASIASRVQILQAENESLAAENGRLRARVEELEASQ